MFISIIFDLWYSDSNIYNYFYLFKREEEKSTLTSADPKLEPFKTSRKHMTSIVCPCGGWYPPPPHFHPRPWRYEPRYDLLYRTYTMFLQWKKPAYSRPGKPFSACLQPRGKTRAEKGTRGMERGDVCGVCAIRQGRSNVASSARIRGDWIDLHKWSRCRRYSLRPLVIFYTYFRPFQYCMLLYSDRKRGGDRPFPFRL